MQGHELDILRDGAGEAKLATPSHALTEVFDTMFVANGQGAFTTGTLEKFNAGKSSAADVLDFRMHQIASYDQMPAAARNTPRVPLSTTEDATGFRALRQTVTPAEMPAPIDSGRQTISPLDDVSKGKPDSQLAEHSHNLNPDVYAAYQEKRIGVSAQEIAKKSFPNNQAQREAAERHLLDRDGKVKYGSEADRARDMLTLGSNVAELDRRLDLVRDAEQKARNWLNRK